MLISPIPYSSLQLFLIGVLLTNLGVKLIDNFPPPLKMFLRAHPNPPAKKWIYCDSEMLGKCTGKCRIGYNVMYSSCQQIRKNVKQIANVVQSSLPTNLAECSINR